jgi:hypothetical protein
MPYRDEISVGPTTSYPTLPGGPPKPIPGRVILWAPDAGEQVVALHSELPQVSSERAGGWRTIDRPQLRPLVAWDGHQPLKVDLKLLLDGHAINRSVAPEQDALRRIAYDVPAGGPRRPPWLRVIGRMPYADSSIKWVIDALGFEDQIYHRGDVTRTVASVTLLEFVSPEIRQRIDKRKKSARATSHKWRQGDTLHKLARKLLGDQRRWREIDKANPKIKNWSKVKVGTTITIPAK